MKASRVQTLLISSGVVASALLGIFFLREISPEYRIYQDDYIALENFRSTYTNEPPPPFKIGVKQVVLEKENKGPAEIDRCISCHVALQIEDFSPTKLAKDINGNTIYDALGFPKKEENPNYIWRKLEDSIKELTNPDINARLEAEGKVHQVKENLRLAKSYEALKVAKVGDYEYAVEKVLSMHPLMGRETRPFEYHPIEEYGCTSCHGGNGRGLVTDRAHGPVFDEQYEPEFQGYRPQFLESDPDNDPRFSKVFNDKPGHRLLFQTNPLYVGSLIQAKCMQCHKDAESSLKGASNTAERILNRNETEALGIVKAFELEKQAVLSLVTLKKLVDQIGFEKALKKLEVESENYTLPPLRREQSVLQLKYLKSVRAENVNEEILQKLEKSFGSKKLAEDFVHQLDTNQADESITRFIQKTAQDQEAKGTLYQKETSMQLNASILRHIQDVKQSFKEAVNDDRAIGSIQTDVDRLTEGYHLGKNLFLSQSCYACHRIAGYTRGGVGPELTLAGETYPWYLKQKISYPQFDLHNSTMPNYRLDHDELEDLVTFLLAQNGPGKKQSNVNYKTEITEWEAGKKMAWEEPVTPAKIHDVRYGMTVFAVEGCAACHRLKGYESNVGFAIEKNKPSFDVLYQEHQWFQQLFPEFIRGTAIVDTLKKHAKEINERIVSDVREGSLLEEIEERHPDTIDSFYTDFKFASRAQNHHFKTLIKQEKDEKKRELLTQELKEWKELVRRVLMVYIQEYGLGRMICPKPNWSGIYHSDQWLMEHFRNPTSHVPRSIMPVFPFDDTKFYALTYMLGRVAKENNKQDRQVWKHFGFKPEIAFQKYCSQCHGEHLFGNGPIAEWIYPIPKNLRKADFLRNLTKENAFQSIMHGVKGTPMPPWGELGKDKSFENNEPILTAQEVTQLVDWLFSSLPGGTVIRGTQDIPKWQYEPEDVLRELRQEGSELKGNEESSIHSFLNPLGNEQFLVSLKPIVGAVSSFSPIKVEDVFDIVQEPSIDGDKSSYYIKKKFYTPANLLEGQRLFYENCAPCHGREADGAGLRAEAMHDAKPRMLTNLDWLQTRDDLRLLRSIKYGVPGTSMTPWGDQTSSLQRLQLVMFIRSLTQAQEEKNSFSRVIYRTFDNAEFLVERARVEEFSKLANLQKEYFAIRQLREELDRNVLAGLADAQKAMEAYQKELEAGASLEMKEKSDQLYQELRKKIKQEKDLYVASGMGFMVLSSDEGLVNLFLQMIAMNENRYVMNDHRLLWSNKNFSLDAFTSLKDKILNHLEKMIAEEEGQKMLLEGKVYSSETVKTLREIGSKISSIKKQKARFLSNLTESLTLMQGQKDLLEAINNPKTQ
ncbi:Uncharacterized protein PHSC3_000830 [Chlamydiales bacterium STE3]|nr:Uncharacterized protein PHSC3_000830 [Chlamydiales bacterium STE3]